MRLLLIACCLLLSGCTAIAVGAGALVFGVTAGACYMNDTPCNEAAGNDLNQFCCKHVKEVEGIEADHYKEPDVKVDCKDVTINEHPDIKTCYVQ